MAGKKKSFPCGHRGKGRYCHRCHAETLKQTAQRIERQAIKDRLERASVELQHLPKRVAVKALQVMEQLAEGAAHMSLGGKRINAKREIVSIPIGRRYRMICKDRRSGLQCLEVISHETYNKRVQRFLSN